MRRREGSAGSRATQTSQGVPLIRWERHQGWLGEPSFAEGAPRLGEAACRSQRQRQEGEEAGGGAGEQVLRLLQEVCPPRQGKGGRRDLGGKRLSDGEIWANANEKGSGQSERVRMWMERDAPTEGCPHGGERVRAQQRGATGRRQARRGWGQAEV